MRAAVVRRWGDVSGLSIETVDAPVASANQAIVRLKVSGLNHLDLWVRRGMPFLRLKLPHILGSDGAGIIEKIGEGVKGFKVGDEVIVHPGLSCGTCANCTSEKESLCPKYQVFGEHLWGTNAEFIAVPEANLFLKPKEISWEVAGSMALVATTAWQMVEKAGLRPGEFVLVNAAGSGVSQALIQLARIRGARVLVTAGSTEKLDFAKSLGASDGWTYDSAEMASDIRQLTGRRGLDVVFDHVGGELFNRCIELLKWGGTLVTCGASAGFEIALDLRQVFYRQLKILGSTMGPKAAFPEILRLVSKGELKIPIHRTFGIDEIQEAHRCIESRSVLGKVVLRHEIPEKNGKIAGA